jgi:hypothetical protein
MIIETNNSGNIIVNNNEHELNSFNKTLQWPVTPERKGKTNSERLPFVITSATWKETKNKKITEKKEKEQAVEGRKRQRLKAKTKAEEKKKVKKMNLSKVKKQNTAKKNDS